MPSGEPAHFNALADDEPRPPPPGLSEAEYRRWEKTENKRLADAKKEKEKVQKRVAGDASTEVFFLAIIFYHCVKHA
jgi:hypothetical protein